VTLNEEEAQVSGFRRERRSRPGDDVPERSALIDGLADPSGVPADEGPAVGARGPWDVQDRPDRETRIDLGALWLPRREGMELRMEVDKKSSIVTAAAIHLHGSALQLQVFGAPRTMGIWDEIRAEIADSITKQGGSVDDLPGPFGRELLARLPIRTAEGRTGHRPARFIGHDGPRWFLRGVLSGRAAAEPDRARELEDVFADVVVIRGSEARVPRDLLPLSMPGTAAPQDAANAPSFDPLTRGPEITEIH
jgi:hypothetical protein